MPNYTKTYKLKKPLGTENYNVEDQNSNMDIIDEELGKQGKQINDCLQPATKDNLGMIKVGDNLTITKEGKLNGAAPYTHPNDTNTRHVTDAQINTWNNKAPAHDHPYIPTSASCNKNWNWSGQDGQPTWLWGGNDPSNMFVYNPANFNVNYANSAGNASTIGGLTLEQVLAKGGDIVGKTYQYELIRTLSGGTSTILVKNYINPKGGMAKIILKDDYGLGNFSIQLNIDGVTKIPMVGYGSVFYSKNDFLALEIPFKNNFEIYFMDDRMSNAYLQLVIHYYINE